nr:hypothetical protein CFP56_77225 [Quercus suber]
MITVAQGMVLVLVKLLDSSSFEMKEKVVSLISRISLVNSSKHGVIAKGLLLLNHLLRVLDSGSAFAKEKAYFSSLRLCSGGFAVVYGF